MSAIKGFGEMLLEDAQEARDEALAQRSREVARSGGTSAGADRYAGRLHRNVASVGDRRQPESAAVSAVLNSVRPLSPAAPGGPGSSRILIVDDTEATRELLSRRLAREGHRIVEAENGRSALERIAAETFDLILLDMMMPDINGYEVLTQLKADVALSAHSCHRHLGVSTRSTASCAASRRARRIISRNPSIRFCCGRASARRWKKRGCANASKRPSPNSGPRRKDRRRFFVNILPKSIIARMHRGETPIADRFHDVTILFSDIVGFTRMSTRRSASDVVALLNAIFSAVDRLALEYGIEKIKTIGDAYMAVAGLPEPRDDHAQAIARLALAMREVVGEVSQRHGENLKIRIGIHTGNTVAGVIGMHKFAYDVWGDTVNTASAMESHGIPNEIQVSHASFMRLSESFVLEPRGAIEIKGKGQMETYFLRGERRVPGRALSSRPLVGTADDKIPRGLSWSARLSGKDHRQERLRCRISRSARD